MSHSSGEETHEGGWVLLVTNMDTGATAIFGGYAARPMSSNDPRWFNQQIKHIEKIHGTINFDYEVVRIEPMGDIARETPDDSR